VTVEILPANQDHNMVTRVTQEATCTHPGAGERVCSRCGKTEQITYEQLSHNYQEKSRLPATCSQPGEKHVICTLCGKEQWIPIPIDPDAHHWLYMGYCWPDDFYECMYCHRRKED
jgi:Fe2+ or Zn2+ uptake regulation protein